MNTLHNILGIRHCMQHIESENYIERFFFIAIVKNIPLREAYIFNLTDNRFLVCDLNHFR